jgi:hypothetical protein
MSGLRFAELRAGLKRVLAQSYYMWLTGRYLEYSLREDRLRVTHLPTGETPASLPENGEDNGEISQIN